MEAGVLEGVVTLLVWPAIGLIAYGVGGGADWRLGAPRLWLHLLAGPIMLVPLAWGYVTSGVEATERNRVEAARGRSPRGRRRR